MELIFKMIALGVFFLMLLIGSEIDLKGKPIPIKLSVIGTGVKAVEMIYYETSDLKLRLLMALFTFVFMLGFAYVSGMGGADCLYMTMIVFNLGFIGAYAILFSFLSALPYAAYMIKKGRRNEEYPFIPFLTVGVIIALLIFF